MKVIGGDVPVGMDHPVVEVVVLPAPAPEEGREPVDLGELLRGQGHDPAEIRGVDLFEVVATQRSGDWKGLKREKNGTNKLERQHIIS